KDCSNLISLLSGFNPFPKSGRHFRPGAYRHYVEAWRGKSLTQLVLAYLYSGLSSACMGKAFYGCAILLDIWLSLHLKMDFSTNKADSHLRAYKQTSIYKIKDVLHFSEMMSIKTLHLRIWSERRSYLTYLPCSEFTFSSKALVSLTLKSRPCQGVDL